MFQARRVAGAIYADERPDRAARLWLALAVATLWMVRVGGALEGGPGPEATDLPDLRPLLGRTWRRQADGDASGCCAWAGCGAWGVRSPREPAPAAALRPRALAGYP